MSVTTKLAAKPTKKWTKPVAAVVLAIVALFLAVLLAKWLRSLPGVQAFLVAYPGQSGLPPGAPLGLPAWLGWQHFLNAFFLVLIIRTGWQVRTTTRPAAYWKRNNKGLVRTKNPPTKVSLDLWLHLSLDALWVLNGIIFIIMLFATGQWMRIVPSRWDTFPNAASALLQYFSLNWPAENGWANYNALQLLSYFTIVFIAAPLALLTGLRMSPAWPKKAGKLTRAFPIEAARAAHVPVMLFFVLFVIIHVTLVFATGALHNLNHMYATRNGGGWTGFWIFATSLAVMVISWILARPLFLRPVASLTGTVTKN